MKPRILIIAGALVVLAACVWGYMGHLHNKGFTPWMEHEALDAHLDSLTKKRGPGTTDYWGYRHWIYAVEGRRRAGVEQFRVKYGNAPNYGIPYRWYWRIGMTKEQFDEATARFKEDGLKVVSQNHFKKADGQQSYQAVWQWVGPERTPDPAPPPAPPAAAEP